VTRAPFHPSADDAPTRGLALIPSYDPDRQTLHSLYNGMRDLPLDVRIIANSRRALVTADQLGIPHITFDDNLGFGRGINRAVGRLNRPYVLILNDDLQVSLPALEETVRCLDARDPEDAWIMHLGDEASRAFPGVRQIFGNLSLLERLAHRFPRGRDSMKTHGYRSFSSVAISRAAWREAEGFDERFPFTFEDADFAKRHQIAGGAVYRESVSSVRHLHSRTSAAHVENVLPLVAWSAQQYAIKWNVKSSVRKPVILAALLVRVALVPFSSAASGAHLKGIARAALAVVKGSEPPLPPYQIE
jgi:GT2 family glycosyltransferase